MSLYSIFVVNDAPGCDTLIEQQITVSGCTTYIIRLAQNSNAIGPFSIYFGLYPVEFSAATFYASGLTRTEMFNGYTIPLDCPTPTPTITPTITPTPSITPTTTPTPSITPTLTQTPTETPSVTSSPTVTPTVTSTQGALPSETPTSTPTNTPTPSITPTNTLTPTPTPTPPIFAYLFIEPQSGSTEIGQYLFDTGISFFGFTNISAPDTTNPAQFNIDMNEYVSFSGWTTTFPSVRSQVVPQNSGGVDSFGNAINAYNFSTHEVPLNTVETDAWYTWIIPTGATNNQIQQKICYSINGNPNLMTTLFMESTIYTNTFNYTGSTIPTGVYRVYTTFADLAFYINNSSSIIYFKGDTII